MTELSRELKLQINAGAESFVYSQDDHCPNLPYKQMEMQAWTAGARAYALRAVKAEAMLEIAEKALRISLGGFQDLDHPLSIRIVEEALAEIEKLSKGGA